MEPGEPADAGRGPRKGGFADLRQRTLTALAMSVVAIAAVGVGDWAFAPLAALIAAGMGWELRRMTAGEFDLAGWLMGAAGAGACLLTQALSYRYGLGWLALCLIPLAVMTRGEVRLARFTALIGTVYVAIACAALVGLRDDDLYGWEAVLWVALTVVATDIGGYFAGRAIGGPKLWPAVSPGKTWAGLGGGMAFAIVVGAVFSSATSGTLFHEVALVSAVMAVVAQGGDLAESALKRRCGVKDSSNLIPGHGGLLDRMDGLLAAGMVAALVSFLRGQSVFIW